jgi:hypothetical protein
MDVLLGLSYLTRDDISQKKKKKKKKSTEYPKYSPQNSKRSTR